MTHSDWDRLADLFERALAQPDESRRAFLREACGGDHALERELRAMLAAVEDSAELSLERKLLSWEDDATGDSDALPAGTRVGAWRIGDPIGHGGMGEVYRASRADGDFSQTVAIKVMRHDVRGVAALRRFRTERMLLARLSHPNISAIVDGGTAPDGRPFLAMQFVDGVPITRYCDEHHLDLDSRLRLFTTVAHAVHHAHVRLIVHRDIKPSNILVSTDGRPVLLDFGIAKLLDRNDAAPDRTQTSHRLLTPEHAAPEQVRGEPVSTATDVYGLGVLLFELVTGVRPFRGAGRSASDLEHAIVHYEPPTPSAVATRLPERAHSRRS
ncbi:MAG: serine/threonine protein kinase [Gemmatimonadaceae bacterium]|nr:serine/threonine protein kinase [Gemmatimonadaceae bacterium]